MVEQGGEPFLLPCLCYFAHTAQSLGHSFPALCRARVGLSDVLLGPHPSLPNLRQGQILFVRLVHRYYGAVRLLQGVHVRRSALRLLGPASILKRPRRPGGLPVLVHVVSQRARFCDYAGPANHSRLTRPAVLPSSLRQRVGVLIKRFSKLNRPPHRSPCLRFDCPLARPAARLGAKMDSLSPFL